ncbi:MAG: hypothetical protein HRU20_31355 [Pseudomonadales bacterium]|nr:hypothetical protein [Pseudomonadales bacterium]
MPVTIQFNQDSSGVELLATGHVLGQDIIQAKQAIIDHPEVSQLQYQLIDKSDCTEYQVNASDIESIADYDRRINVQCPGILAAIIESKTLRYSLSPLWQAHINSFNMQNASFTSREDALSWIRSKLEISCPAKS